MNMEISFSPGFTTCPKCGSRLVLYKTERRVVKSVDYGFTAVHRPMICRHDGTIFRSERISGIVSPHCTYANQVMLESATRRYIDGRSSSEIALGMNNGISERHVRRLSNMALDIFPVIHSSNADKLRSCLKSYILQIDGTTDSDFSMIVAVRDSISDFVLHVDRCSSESEESMKAVLRVVNERFGDPSGITCDMRSGIISAAQSMFPKTPIRICLMHFLRDLGKDLLLDMHTDLGIMINRMRIKSTLKSILRDIPDNDQKTLDEIGDGYVSDRDKVEIMAVRRILEKLIETTGSSGYGFPFSLKHMNFYLACLEAKNGLAGLSEKIVSEKAKEYVKSIMPQLFRNVGTCSGFMPSDSRISFCFLVISVVISLPSCSITFLSLCNSRIIFSTEYLFSMPDDLMYARILDLMAIAMRFTNISPLSASMP